jgi:hypothetical protein
MNEVDFLADEITLRYGNVTRARGCFLYTAKNVRLTDMYQEAGRAILGWGGGSAFTMLKNTLSRGITGSYNTCYTNQIKRAVSELLASERTVYIFKDKQKALRAALAISPQSTSFWKPWSESVDWRTITSVIVEPPLPWTAGIYLLAVLDTPEVEATLAAIEQTADTMQADQPQSPLQSASRLPAPVAAAVTRSFYDMVAALQSRKESDWFIYDTVLTKYWTRKGPYLYPKISKEQYGAFILHCLDCEVVVSPVFEIPSIVPYGADRGVFGKLKKTPFVEGESK